MASEQAPRRRIGAWIAIGTGVAVLLVVAAASAGVMQMQSSYPGGAAQWAKDVRGPARVTQAEARATILGGLAATQATTWHKDGVTTGSAFAYSTSGVLITVAHVLPYPLVKLAVVDAAGTTYPADLVEQDTIDDLAILRVKGTTQAPLKASSHPLYAHSRVYIGGLSGSGPGTVITGEIQKLDYQPSLKGISVTHAILATAGPVSKTMNGGPVIDEWGGVVGVLLGATDDGRGAVIVPLKALASIAAYALIDVPVYIGTPLITSSGFDLVLRPNNFPNRNAKWDINEVSYSVGSQSSATFSKGDLWVGVQKTIEEAATLAKDCRAHLGKGWPSVSEAPYAIGDGGRLVLAHDNYGAYVLMLCWSDRNAAAEWWIEARGKDELAFFTQIANAQEAVLYDAK